MAGNEMTAREYEAAVRRDIVFAEHDGVSLLGDLYLPEGVGKAPVLVGVHGGGWQTGDRKFYTHWGNYLAKHGYAVFAIEYRLMKPGVKTWPGAVYDTKAVPQFVRAEAAEFGLDAERVGLIGDSAGAHLSALAALAGQGAPEKRVGWKTAANHCCRTLCFSRCVTAAWWTGPSNQDQPQVHVAPRDGISGFGGGGRSRSTSRIPSSETQPISQKASM